MRTQRIIEAIQERSGLSRLEGHALYAYRLTEEELYELREALQDEIVVNPELRRIEQRAAFCLFGAEWFRRNHVDGRWKWDTILKDGLELNDYSNEKFRRRVRELTDEGLRWWNVPVVHTDAGDFRLVSLACQGGLPLRTLKNHGSGLRSFFRAVLRHHERYRSEPLNSIVEEHCYLLRTTLDNSGVHTLAVCIVEAIAKLRKESSEFGTTGMTRQEYLDEHAPGWRNTIPVRMEDTESLDLILGLLDQEGTRALPVEGFSITTSLFVAGGGLTIVRSLEFEQSVVEADLVKWLELADADLLHPRMTLYLQSPAEQIRVATISRTSSGDHYHIARVPSDPICGSDAAGTLQLVATAGPHKVASVIVPGGAALGDSPWVFADAEAQELIGIGSVRTRRNSVLVALPAGSDWRAIDDARIEPREDMVFGRHIARVSGQMDIGYDGALVRVQTCATKDMASVFKLRGRIAILGPQGSQVWRGRPRITEYRLDEDGIVSDIPDDMIRWRHATGKEWHILSSECIGDVVLRAERDGESIFQTSATILPREFSFRVRPGMGQTGDVVLSGLGSAAVFAAECPEAVIDVDDSGIDVIVVRVRVTGTRPATLPLRIVFATGGQCEVVVPCPVSSVSLVNAAGRVIASDRMFPLVPLADLDGLYLQVVSADNRERSLIERSEQRFLARPEESSTEGIQEIPLSSIQTYARGLLAQSAQPDDGVELQLLQSPQAQPVFRFKVSRYAGSIEKLNREDFTDVFVEPSTLASLGVSADSLSFRFAPLGDPEDLLPDEAILQSGEASWRVYHDSCEPGPYLATVWLNEYTCLRPLRVTIRFSEVVQQDISEVAPEQKYYAALNADDHERRFVWDRFADELAVDHFHPGWIKVDALLKCSRTLPVTTFEAVAAITRNSEAVARVGFSRPKEGWLWRRVDELPFLWSMIPIQSWVAAATRRVDFLATRLREAGISEDSIQQQIQKMFQDFAEHAPSQWRGAGCVAACMYASGLDLPSKLIPLEQLMPVARPALLEQREGEFSRLIADHDKYDTRQTWPRPHLNVSDEVREIAEPLKITEGHVNQQSVLNAPAIAAVYSVYDIPYPQDLVLKLQQLRGVDPDWFDAANAIAMLILAGNRLTNDCHCFRSTPEDQSRG